jgi:hypothetical protein
MTPRQISAFSFLIARRKEQECATILGITSLGAQGGEDAINKQIDKWANPR